MFFHVSIYKSYIFLVDYNLKPQIDIKSPNLYIYIIVRVIIEYHVKYFSHPDKCLSYNITFRTSYNLAFSLISWLTIAKTEPFLSCYFQTSRNRSDMKKIIITLWFIIIYFPFNYHHNHITLSPVNIDLVVISENKHIITYDCFQDTG